MRKPFHSEWYQGPWLQKAAARSRKHPYFEGWYFKHALPSGRVIAFIPGVSLGDDAHSFIQVNDSLLGSAYARFPLEAAELDPEALSISIAGNRFSTGGIRLSLTAEQLSRWGSMARPLEADISFGPFASLKPGLWRPGIMGPFSYIPRMECYHGLVSMNHLLGGRIRIAEEPLELEGGRGYIEKDFGSSFPLAWIWIQANSFEEEASFMLSQAHIPMGKLSFPGHLGFFYHREILPEPLVFASYEGLKIRKTTISEQEGITDLSIRIAGKQHGRNIELEVLARVRGGYDLMAPVAGKMSRVIKETLEGDLDLVLRMDGRELYRGHSPAAGIEVQGPVASLLLGE